MNARKIAIIVLTLVLIGAVFTGAVSALNGSPAPVVRTQLANVRDFNAVAAEADSYAVDGGVLFKGQPGSWTQVATPEQVIVSAVAVDSKDPSIVYIGAANEMAIFRTMDNGRSWLRIPLNDSYVGGVTDIAVDGAQRILYVGTDTAGLFRMRDVGSSVILSGHLLLDAPVLEVVADSTGKGMAFARTEWNLYRAENYGLAWVAVGNLQSAPTAVAIANTDPAKVYVGTMDRGLLVSNDGREWATANDGLNFVPGSRLMVKALAIDPAQPEVMYVATSYLYGTSEIHEAAAGVALSTDGAQAWSPINEAANLAVAELLPVSGLIGGVYALTTDSRTPMALGNAPVITEVAVAAQPVAQPETSVTSVLAWIIAGLAALALIFAVAMDLRSRRPELERPMEPSTIRNR
ncbi:MAG: hypothetical protein IT328_25795 [Caldilineaceae bacterium]|nr:hypothetical protein [Caldilineaceae bacterium]